MDWKAENASDARLLELRSLQPLGASAVAEEEDLVGLIETHNFRRTRAIERVRILAGDRKRLDDFDVWIRADSADVDTARCHVHREEWDMLVGLRRLLEERLLILDQMERRLRDRSARLEGTYSIAVAEAEKRLSRQRRELERAVPVTAAGHFYDLVMSEPPVVEAARALNGAQRDVEAASSAQHGIQGDLTVVSRRQREVFARLIAW